MSTIRARRTRLWLLPAALAGLFTATFTWTLVWVVAIATHWTPLLPTLSTPAQQAAVHATSVAAHLVAAAVGLATALVVICRVTRHPVKQPESALDGTGPDVRAAGPH